MSSDGSPVEGQRADGATSQNLPVVREDKTNVWDVFKTTLPILFAGVFGLAGLVLIYWIGVPVESLKYVFVALCLGGPFIVAYSFAFVWLLHERRGHYHLVLDRDHQKISLKHLDPATHRTAEIVGNAVTRQSRNGAGRVTIHAEAEVEQRERVDDQGEPEMYRQLVFTSPWSGFVDPLKVLERWSRYEKAREKLVPLAKSALELRASVDSKTLEATDKAAHAVIKGAEEDSFISGEDPFDWDHLDTGDLDDVFRTNESGKDVEDELPDELSETQSHEQ